MTPAPAYKVMSRACDECLATRRRIVSGKRAAQLISECRESDVKFVCHKTSDVACRGVSDRIGLCRAARFAKWAGIAIVEIDPDTLEPVAP